MLSRFARYFAAVAYCKDEDSGHWEEQRKISASSIGVVVRALITMLKIDDLRSVERNDIDAMVRTGQAARHSIRPWGCTQPERLLLGPGLPLHLA